MTTVEVDPRDLTRLVAALNKEADGKELRRELIAGLKAAAEPAAVEARGAILSMRSHSNVEPPLRQAVADAVTVQVRTGGGRAGVFVVARKRGMPRGFANAPKRLNAKGGWRHPLFGTDEWKTQIGKPGWFDETLARAEPAAEAAAKEAMDGMARRIEERTKG